MRATVKAYCLSAGWSDSDMVGSRQIEPECRDGKLCLLNRTGHSLSSARGPWPVVSEVRLFKIRFPQRFAKRCNESVWSRRAALGRFPKMVSRGSANVLYCPVLAVGLDRLQRLHARGSRLGNSPQPSSVHIQGVRRVRFARFGFDALG